MSDTAKAYTLAVKNLAMFGPGQHVEAAYNQVIKAKVRDLKEEMTAADSEELPLIQRSIRDLRQLLSDIDKAMHRANE